jgi:hypothetical protein
VPVSLVSRSAQRAQFLNELREARFADEIDAIRAALVEDLVRDRAILLNAKHDPLAVVSPLNRVHHFRKTFGQPPFRRPVLRTGADAEPRFDASPVTRRTGAADGSRCCPDELGQRQVISA